MSDSWNTWLEEHRPDHVAVSDEKQLLDYCINAVLTLRLQPITIDEVMILFRLDRSTAERMCYKINHIIDQVESCLLEALSTNQVEVEGSTVLE